MESGCFQAEIEFTCDASAEHGILIKARNNKFHSIYERYFSSRL